MMWIKHSEGMNVKGEEELIIKIKHSDNNKTSAQKPKLKLGLFCFDLFDLQVKPDLPQYDLWQIVNGAGFSEFWDSLWRSGIAFLPEQAGGFPQPICRW